MDLLNQRVPRLETTQNRSRNVTLNLALILGVGEEHGVPELANGDFEFVTRRAFPYIQRNVRFEDIEEERVRRLAR